MGNYLQGKSNIFGKEFRFRQLKSRLRHPEYSLDAR